MKMIKWLFSLTAATALALTGQTESKSIEVLTQEELTAALTEFKDGDDSAIEVTLNGEGPFTTFDAFKENDFSGKTLTFNGNGKEQTLWKYGNTQNIAGEHGADYSLAGAHVTFKALTLTDNCSPNSYYRGFVRCASFTVEDCKITNLMGYLGVGPVLFKDCTFDLVSSAEYCVKTYSGTSFTFDGCTFIANNKGFIQGYIQDQSGTHTAIINNCTFKKGTGSISKTAFNFYDLRGDSEGTHWTIHFMGNNVNEDDCIAPRASYDDDNLKSWLFDVKYYDKGRTANIFVNGIQVVKDGAAASAPESIGKVVSMMSPVAAITVKPLSEAEAGSENITAEQAENAVASVMATVGEESNIRDDGIFTEEISGSKFLSMVMLSADVEKRNDSAAVTSMSFEVTPSAATVADGIAKSVEAIPNSAIGKPITFRLPVDNSVAVGTGATVKHNGTAMTGPFAVVEDSAKTAKYIEVSSAEFSTFSYELQEGDVSLFSTIEELAAASETTYDEFADYVTYTYYEDKDCYNQANESGVQWVKSVTIKGLSFGELKDDSTAMVALQKVLRNYRRTDTPSQFQDSISVAFENCTFKQTSAHIQVYKIRPCDVTDYTFKNCTFTQDATGQYAITLNCNESGYSRPISYTLDGCTITSAGRGINIVPGTEAESVADPNFKVTIKGCTFNLPSESDNHMALQIAGNWDGANLTAAGNELIEFKDNTIASAYCVVRVNNTMSNNTTDAAKYIFAASGNALPEGIKGAVTKSTDTDPVTLAIAKAFDDIIFPSAYVAQIGDKKYATFEEAIADASEGDEIIVIGYDAETMTAPQGYVFQTVGDVTKLVVLTNWVTVSGIAGFEGKKYASFQDAYDAISPTVIERLGAGEEIVTDATFEELFTDIGTKSFRRKSTPTVEETVRDAHVTFAIHGTVEYVEDDAHPNLLSFGRASSHLSGSNGSNIHWSTFKFVADDEGATLVVGSEISYPYEWWSEDFMETVSFEDLTIKATDAWTAKRLTVSSFYTEGADITLKNCTLDGVHYYDTTNARGDYLFEGNKFINQNGKGYFIFVQGGENKVITVKDNEFSGTVKGGLNISGEVSDGHPDPNYTAVIAGNKFAVEGRNVIQLTKAKNVTITGNEVSNTKAEGSFVYMYGDKLADATVTIRDNKVESAYLFLYANKSNTSVPGLTYAPGAGTVIGHSVETSPVKDSSTGETITNKAFEAIVGGIYYGSVALAASQQADGKLTDGVFTVEPSASLIAEGKASVANTEAETKALYPFMIGVGAVECYVDIQSEDGTTGTIVLSVAQAWIDGNVDPAGEEPTTEEIRAVLNASQANGLKGWENYVLGLDGKEASSLLAAVQGSLTDEEKAALADGAEPVVIIADLTDIAPPADTGVTVRYRLVTKAIGGAAWTPVGEVMDAPRFIVDMSARTGDSLWKIEAVFTGTKVDAQ